MHAINVSQFSVSWILILCLHQTRLKAPSTATGCTASSGTRPPAHVTGPAGTAPPPSSSASAACSTTRRLTPATGLRTLPGARSTVSLIRPPSDITIMTMFTALCKDDANGNVPLGKSCNRYWACQGGYPRLQRCPAMLVFDKNRRRCVTPPTEDCEVPTTKAPPPGEENNFNSGSGGRGEERVQQSPNPRRGGGGRRPQQQSAQPARRPQSEPLPFNLPPGAVPLSQGN